MPFLQMLQSVESPPLFPFKGTNFRTLLRLQHMKQWEEKSCIPRMDTQIQTLELESCVTHDMVEMQSPVKSESNDFQNPHSASCVEKLGSECNQEGPTSAENCSIDANGGSPVTWANQESWLKETQCPKSQLVGREKRKRKRTRPAKNKEDVENQRMTHIAVERNRRPQMNDHLSVLRSLMPPSYIQRNPTRQKPPNPSYNMIRLNMVCGGSNALEAIEEDGRRPCPLPMQSALWWSRVGLRCRLYLV